MCGGKKKKKPPIAKAVLRKKNGTGGINLPAKTSKALSRLNEMFRKGEVKKTYWAIVKNTPPQPQDTLVHYITRNEKNNKSTAHTTARSGGQRAELDYRLIATGDNYRLLEINLKTGRHHQIRCQLAKIGCPIKGDLKYGSERSNPDGGISLHARRVTFEHPVSHLPIDITAPVPDERLWQALTSQVDESK